MAATETVDVTMPQMGVSVSEGTITKWLKQVGEAVEADEPLLEISTDKVDTEVPSPGSGVLQEILVQEGETVEVGVKLATIGPEGGGAAAPTEERAEEQEHAQEPPPEPATQAAADASMAAASEGVGDVAPSSPGAESVPAEPAPAEPSAAEPAAAAPSGNGKTFVSPVVARIASEHGVDPQQVPGTGRGGRVTKKDILGFIESGGDAAATAPAEAPAQPEPAQPEPAQPEPAQPEPAQQPEQPAEAQIEQPAEPPQPRPAQPQAVPEKPKAAPAPAAQAEPEPGELEEPMTAMRRGIAEHMRRSLDTSAHVTSAIEVDMTRVVAIRGKLKREYQETYGVNPTYLSFVARAAVETLKDYPWINGEIRGDKIVTRNYVNLGFAVELADGKGLIVPVLKHCEGLNLLGIARGVADVAQRARDKKLLPDEVQGGTFTITNPGGYGTFHGTPVISQPQAGILGTYALVKRPWVVQDEHGQDVIAIRPIMNITLTYDHRLVDGALAGRFLRDLRQRLESWGESDY